MTGTDPAIEAARRAFDHWRFARPKKNAEVLTETAAREALKPIRAWYEALPESAHVPDLDGLLPLICTTEELENPDD